MPKYATNTNVSSELSRLEIEKILLKYGAENFAYATANGQALIVFRMNGKQVKFILPLPQREEFKLTETGRTRTENSQYEACENCEYYHAIYYNELPVCNYEHLLKRQPQSWCYVEDKNE